LHHFASGEELSTAQFAAKETEVRLLVFFHILSLSQPMDNVRRRRRRRSDDGENFLDGAVDTFLKMKMKIFDDDAIDKPRDH